MSSQIRTILSIADPLILQSTSVAADMLGSSFDAVIVDMVGLIAAAADLDAAFAYVAAAAAITPRVPLYLRLPDLDHRDAIALLGRAVATGVEGIVLPDAINGQDVTRLDARISVEEAVQALDHGRIGILVEVAGSARAALALPTFRGASHRLRGLIWSPQCLARDLGDRSPIRPNGHWLTPVAFVAGQCVVSASAAGVPAILDMDGLWTEHTGEERRLMAEADGFHASLIRL